MLPSDSNPITMKTPSIPHTSPQSNLITAVVEQTSDKNAALLLASLAAIASKEIDVNSNALDERDETTHALFEAKVRKISIDYEHPTTSSSLTDKHPRLRYSHRSKGRVRGGFGSVYAVKNNSVEDDWYAIVSDSSLPNTPLLQADLDSPTAEDIDSIPSLTHGLSSQINKERENNFLKSDSNITKYAKVERSLRHKPAPVTKTILRRKFSWKNYPELEAFLIANRDEYLRHSALNYTIQQKQYNNRLTEQLLELAMEHGYVFDKKEFSFVAVRDRIRCYYKSFVQSSKKRGVIIGYAARRAGLLTKEDLKRSAGKEGKIFVPKETLD